MDEQIQDRYDELADQNEIGICHHVYHLLPEKGGEQEVCSSSHWEGPPAYRHWQRLPEFKYWDEKTHFRHDVIRAGNGSFYIFSELFIGGSEYEETIIGKSPVGDNFIVHDPDGLCR